MVKTGYISFITETGGGQDLSGNPVAPTAVATSYIECNLNTITKEYKTSVDGDYLQAAYSCYIDSDKITALAISLNTIKKVQLQDNNANALGVFRIHNVEYLNLTNHTKIIV